MTTENLPPAPGGRCTFAESHVETADGARLRVRAAQLGEGARAEVVVTHGLGEHVGRYLHVAAALAEHGLRATGYDLRGHGRSSGRRGDVDRYERLIEDLRAVHESVARSGRPVFLFGHSFGGQIVLRYLQREAPTVAGAIVSAPWLWLGREPALWKRVLGRWAHRYFPALRFPTGMRLGDLTHDLAHVEAMGDRDLVHCRISARMFYAACDAGERALDDAGRVRVPLLLMHGQDDPIVAWRVTREFHARPGPAEKTLKVYPGMLHEILNEEGRDTVLRDLAEWIVRRL
jgi:alpha-beta hydrolase superfamily lysophospholipase